MGVSFFEQNGTRAAADRESDTQLNQLSDACGLFIDDDQIRRIVEWERNTNTGRILADANQEGNQINELNRPTKVIVDKQNAR